MSGERDTNQMIRALVITHGDIGRELVRVAEMILGPVSGLDSMSNSGMAAPDITAQIEVWLSEDSGGGAVDPAATDQKIILIDDYGGSCATSAQLACRQDPDTAIVSGVNLARLLGFVTWRDSADFDQVVAKIVQKGREAIVHVGGR
jgi:mannose/fructose-specific phosphotransferase system component IIA